MVIALLTIPSLGLLSDRVGRKPLIWLDVVGLIVLAFPMVLLLRSDNPVAVFGGLLLMGLTLIHLGATMPSTLPSLFPTEVRGAGLSVPFNVAVSLFFLQDPNGRRMWGSAPAAASQEEAREPVPRQSVT